MRQTNRSPADQRDLDNLVAGIRRKRQEALKMPPKPPGCPVCARWRLRAGEIRHDDGHATACRLRGVTRYHMERQEETTHA